MGLEKLLLKTGIWMILEPLDYNNPKPHLYLVTKFMNKKCSWNRKISNLDFEAILLSFYSIFAAINSDEKMHLKRLKLP